MLSKLKKKKSLLSCALLSINRDSTFPPPKAAQNAMDSKQRNEISFKYFKSVLSFKLPASMAKKEDREHPAVFQITPTLKKKCPI